MDYSNELRNYLDKEGRVMEFPSRRNKGKERSLVLHYLASKFQPGVIYTEREVNRLLNQHHTFGDPAMLRRELFEHQMLHRRRDGSAYWVGGGSSGESVSESGVVPGRDESGAG